MGHLRTVKATEEFAELRVAYAAETEAVARFGDIQRRLVQAQAEIVLRQRDKEMMAGRASRGEGVTGTDLRKATEAIGDAEATVMLLTDALPLTAGEVSKAMSKRSSAESGAKQQCTAHLQRALDDATAALKAAQEAHARALADVNNMPADTRETVDDVLHAHGRDAKTIAMAAEIARIRELNMDPMRKLNNRPAMPWPNAAGKAEVKIIGRDVA